MRRSIQKELKIAKHRMNFLSATIQTDTQIEIIFKIDSNFSDKLNNNIPKNDITYEHLYLET